MRKERLVSRDLEKVARNQVESVMVQRIVVSILTRGFFGRMKWLVLGK
jgi:hypothetical protein